MINGQEVKRQFSAIVDGYQQRTFCEQIDLLGEKGKDIAWITNKIQTDFVHGINNNPEALETRRRLLGSNQKEKAQLPGLLKLFCQALKDFTLRILLVAACISIVLQTSTAKEEDRSIAWIEGFAILIAVFVCALVTAVNDYQKQRQFQELNSVAQEKKIVTVKRGGIQLELHQDHLLVGDIVHIVEGMEIPADGILFESNQITTDESAMTGQSEPMPKNVLLACLKKRDSFKQQGNNNQLDKHQIPSPILTSGTKILTGQGKMVVMLVGQYSCLGKLMKILAKDDPNPTPLQEKLESVAEDIGKFGLYSAIFIVIVLLIRFAIVKGTATAEEDKWQTGHDLVKILDFFILGITVIVVAIPEGLPLSVTLSLAFSVKKMLKDNNLVRKMEACQTMGGANNICSDKTGTLTMNQMTISQVWNGTLHVIDTSKPSFSQSDLSSNPEFNQIFKINSLVNSSAQLNPPKGSSTDIAFLKYFQKMGIDYVKQRQNCKIQAKFPFSSSRKRMSMIVNYKEQLHLFTKGASEWVLKGCHDWYNPYTGNIQSLNRNKADDIIQKMAESALRTLCLAFKKLSGHDNFQTKDSQGIFEVQKNNLILLTIVGVRDVPRPEVPHAIELCHQAGITVRMVTGDNLITAKAIAKQIGLYRINQHAIAMQGLEFNQLVGGIVCNHCEVTTCDCPTTKAQAQETGKQIRVDKIAKPEQFDKIKDDLLVLARSRPEDKYCLVTGLKERGNVVAVTGDGTNDSPALKKADVGFAMGISGTEVARQASAIILIDDNFNSIVKAVLWGRNIYDSIRKFIQFQLTVNVVAVVITLIGAALLQRQVLKPIQMLWINLIMDTLASLALATQEPHPELLLRKPHSRDDYIISKTMLKHIIGQSIFQITIMMILVFMGEKFLPQYVDNYDGIEPYLSHPYYKWRDGMVGSNICSGRFYFLNGDKDYESAYEATHNYSRHFTYIFNTFVMMQIFNFLNARKLHEEFNIFSGIHQNPIFLIVLVSIIGVQIILVTFAGYAFGLHSKGLTIQQWLICAGFGAISLVVSLIVKLLPFWKENHNNEAAASGKVIPEPRQPTSSADIQNSKVILDSFDKFQTMKAEVQDQSEMFILQEPQIGQT